MFNSAYDGTPVLVTGHTGFKGSWLSLWLQKLGAEVTGYALPPPTRPNHATLLDQSFTSISGEITDFQQVLDHIARHKPTIVFHLAAQPLVPVSYKDPIGTFTTNVMGTVNLLEACYRTESVRAVVVITTDKVYANEEWVWGYRENDRLGGYDPYSASKACAELVVASYRSSFSELRGAPLVATARAGNVVGGGDWTKDRLIPDVMRAASKAKNIHLRGNPDGVRPWQHVLDPLAGYLTLGEHLLAGDPTAAIAWNFGPDPEVQWTVLEVMAELKKLWPEVEYDVSPKPRIHETERLILDSTQARIRLGWHPVWSIEQTLSKTVDWYRHYYGCGKALSREQIDQYVSDARRAGLTWAI
jgi:CDP-glucose 4,6-dehydratase